jgi:hypothetical protein
MALEEYTPAASYASSSSSSSSSSGNSPAMTSAASKASEQKSSKKTRSFAHMAQGSSSSSNPFLKGGSNAIAQSMSSDISWTDIEESELTYSVSTILARLDIESRQIAEGDKPITISRLLQQELPLLANSIICGCRAAGLTHEDDDDDVKSSSLTYLKCFKGTPDEIVASIRSLNTDTNRPMYKNMLIVHRFISALAKPPMGFMMNSLGKEGSIHAVALIARALAQERRIPIKELEMSLKYSESVIETVKSAFAAAFTGCSGLGARMLEICSRLLLAIGRRYSTSPDLIQQISEHLKAATASYTQLFERCTHVVEQERLVVNTKTSSSGKKTKMRVKVPCKRYPTVDTKRSPLLDTERTYCTKYNQYINVSPTVVSNTAGAQRLILTDRVRLTHILMAKLYANSKRISEVLNRRRGQVSQLVREARIHHGEGISNLTERNRMLHEPITPAEWNAAEVKLLEALRIKADDLMTIMLSNPFNSNHATAVERVEFDFIEGFIHSSLEELFNTETLFSP